MTPLFNRIQWFLFLLGLAAACCMFGSIIVTRSLFYFDIFGASTLIIFGIFSSYTGFRNRNQPRLSSTPTLLLGRNLIWPGCILILFGIITLALKFI